MNPPTNPLDRMHHAVADPPLGAHHHRAALAHDPRIDELQGCGCPRDVLEVWIAHPCRQKEIAIALINATSQNRGAVLGALEAIVDTTRPVDAREGHSKVIAHLHPAGAQSQ